MQVTNYDAFKKAEELINLNESIPDYLRSKGFQPKLMMECIFHKHGVIGVSRSTPSLSIAKDGKRFKCFSCGVSGRFCDMLYFYKRDVQERVCTKEEAVEEYLQENPEIKAKYGISDFEDRIQFTPEAIKYLIETGRECLKVRREQEYDISERVKSGSEYYFDRKKFEAISDEKEIMDFLSSVQYRDML